MRPIPSPAGEFVIPLSFVIDVRSARRQPFFEEEFNRESRNRIFGHAWASFWAELMASICNPGSRRHQVLFPRSRTDFQPWDKHDTGRAFITTPDGLEHLDVLSEAEPDRIQYVLHHIEREVMPSYDFVGALSPVPVRVPGEQLALAAGYAFNEECEKELGIVFSAKLLDFYAEEGSLRTAGTVILTFFGTSLLLPLFIEAISPMTTDIAERAGSTFSIERELARQNVRCQANANFRFSRTELIMKLEHRLGIGGRSSVCELQSALLALGYSPGRIDGVNGANTQAAVTEFADDWGLSKKSIGRPVFFHAVAKAMMGERPLNK